MRQSKKQRSSVLQRKIHGLREREIDREGSLPACFNRKHKEERERERDGKRCHVANVEQTGLFWLLILVPLFSSFGLDWSCLFRQDLRLVFIWYGPSIQCWPIYTKNLESLSLTLMNKWAISKFSRPKKKKLLDFGTHHLPILSMNPFCEVRNKFLQKLYLSPRCIKVTFYLKLSILIKYFS